MSCPRTSAIEALRDGRLPEDERVELELHVHECADCAEEDRELGALSARLRIETAEVPDRVMLERIREKVLAPPAPRPRTSRAAWLLAAAVVTLIVWRLSPRAAETATAPAPPPPATRVDAVDEGGARWSTSDEGSMRRIDLLEGALALRIDRPPGGHRVVVRVPDGEIEDVGTEFHVQVAGGHTNAVRVDHGAVVLRLEGAPPRAIHAGESWVRSVPEPPAPAPPPSRSPAAIAPRPSASARTVDDGEEDRAYVEILRLLREDRPAEARLAARRYLERFPTGFRRAEVERVLTP